MKHLFSVRGVSSCWRTTALLAALALWPAPANANLPNLDFGTPASLPAGAACSTSTSCTIVGGTYTVGLFNIPAGVMVRVTGNTPLVVYAGTVTIVGTLDLGASVAGGGAGGVNPGDNGAGGRTLTGSVVDNGGQAAPYVSSSMGGGGGGGNGGGGGSGGGPGQYGEGPTGAGGSGIGSGVAGGAPVNADSPGNPGQGGAGGGRGAGGASSGYTTQAGGDGGGGVTGAQGDPLITVFAGGGGGGHGGWGNPATSGGGQGGAGGGATHLIATISIDISGTVRANGTQGTEAGGVGWGGCGGGGAGGTIWLSAPTITNTGTVQAIGGAGGGGHGGYGGGGGGGAGRIRVDTESGATPSGTFVPAIGYTGTIVNAVPLLNTLPRAASVAPGSGATTVNLVGAHFASGTVANVGGTDRTTTFVDGNRLQVELTALDLASRSTLNITTFSPAPAGGTSNTLPLHVTTPQAPVFAPPAKYTIALMPRVIAVGDLDGDGDPDIVVANLWSYNVQVWLNTGGTFTLQQTIGTGWLGGGVALGDLNGDGLLDIVQPSRNSVNRALGTGGGSFGPTVGYSAAIGYPQGTVLGDFNRDGALDVALTDRMGDNVLVVAGDGTGGFGATLSSNAVGTNPIGLAAGDFNGDGRLDLVVANQQSASVSVLLGEGTGSFAPAVAIVLGSDITTTAVRVADLDGDGILDLVVHLDYPNITAVLMGDGTGNFIDQVDYNIRAGTDGPDEMAIGDINGDGIPDLVTASANDAHVAYALGDGAGGFGPPATISVDADPEGVAVADFNGDGRLDIVVTNDKNRYGNTEVNSTLTVLLQRGALGADPTSLSFGPQPMGTPSAPLTVTISNSGPGATGTLSTSIGGTNPGQFAIVSDGCLGTSLSVGGTCQVQVRFTASAIAAVSAMLQVTGASATGVDVALSGSGLDTVAPTVTVVRPNVLAEKLLTGSPYVIEWTAGDNVGLASFNVEFSSDGGLTYSAVPGCTGVAGALRSCVWSAPGPVTTKGKVRVTAFDTSDLKTISVPSAAFTIAAGTGTITISAPNTAVDWPVGSTQKITWSHNLGLNSWVRIEISRDGRRTWEVLSPSFKNTGTSSGTFTWVVTVPTVEGLARIRVTGLNVPASDVSNVDFTVSQLYVALAAPATTSTNLGYGTSRTQTWTTNLGALDKVNVLLSTDGGATFPVVLGSNITATTRTLTYTVPDPGAPSTNARTRVAWTSNPAVGGTNPVPLKMQPAYVTVTTPTVSTDVWLVGTTQNVTWSSNLGTLEKVKIELSLDGGSIWITLTVPDGTPSDGTERVVVQPGWVTPTARVRVTWTKNAAVTSVSYQSFVIR